MTEYEDSDGPRPGGAGYTTFDNQDLRHPALDCLIPVQFESRVASRE